MRKPHELNQTCSFLKNNVHVLLLEIIWRKNNKSQTSWQKLKFHNTTTLFFKSVKISVQHILEVIINTIDYFLRNWFFNYMYKYICVFTGLNNGLSPLFYLIYWLTVFALEIKSTAAQGTLRNCELLVFLLHENFMKTIQFLLAIKIYFCSEIQKKGNLFVGGAVDCTNVP